MNLKYLVGKSINDILLALIKIKPSLLLFIPNGRFVELDLIRSKEKIDTIFDVGANIGQTAIEFSKIFPSTTIHSFEPVKSSYLELEKSAKKYKNIIPNKVALGYENTTLNIVLNEDSELNSLNDVVDSNAYQTEMIDVITGISYCTKNNITAIDLLKIDTEGFELNVLKGFGDTFLTNNIKFIYCEVGFDPQATNKTHFSLIEEYLRSMGFITSGFYEQSRWGTSKLMLGFSNVLFTNTNIVTIF